MTVANLDLINCLAPALVLDGATIGGTLNLQGADPYQREAVTLSINGADIKADAILAAVTATGQARAVGVTIGGDLYLQGAILTNEGGDALNLDSAHIEASANLATLTATGGVRARGAAIGGQLRLPGAILTNEGGDALTLDGANINADAILAAVTTTGGFRAIGVTIRGQLVLQGATLANQGGDALILDGADIKSGAFLNPVTATGEIRAIGVTISGELSLQGAILTNEGGDALALRAARLARLHLTPAEVKGTIALDAAQISELTTPDDMTVLIDNELFAAGWRLGDVRGGIRHDRKAAARWLSRDNATDEFVAQPWHALANLYERNGQPADARWMRWKAARGVTRTSPLGPKLIRWIYGALTGHGYYPLVAALWLILAIVVSGVIVATHDEAFTPTDTNKVAWRRPPPEGQPSPPITGDTPCRDLKDRATCLKPALYAFDNALLGTLATRPGRPVDRQRRRRRQCMDPLRPRRPQDRKLDPGGTPPRRRYRTTP
jgi:hypothetical protein